MPLAGERIAARKDASTWLAQSESSEEIWSRWPPPTPASTRLADAFLRAAIRSPALSERSESKGKDASTELAQSGPTKEISNAAVCNDAAVDF
jgi:hypothetical protein